jgi:hypothetical protein
MIDLEDRSVFLVCNCKDKDHILQVTLNTDYDGDAIIIFNTCLNYKRPFYIRIWIAILYIFGRSTSFHYHFDEVLVSSALDILDLDKLFTSARAIKKIREGKKDVQRRPARAGLT